MLPKTSNGSKHAGSRFAGSRYAGRGLLWTACGSLLLMTAGCGGKDPVTVPPADAPSQVRPQLAPPTEPPPLPPPIREVQPSVKPRVRVIDPGGEDGQPKTLIEASRLAKERKRGRSQEPIAEINDDNLAEYAEGAEVIILESEPAAPLGPDYATTQPNSSYTDGDIRDEDYWRNRGLELRMGWRKSVDELNELELESAALRQQFYAEEDSYIRDSQIKPAWDRTLDQLDTLRRRAQRYSSELETFVQEGARVGADQVWLNQGWELEPTTEEQRLVDQLLPAPASEPGSQEPQSQEPDTRDPIGN